MRTPSPAADTAARPASANEGEVLQISNEGRKGRTPRAAEPVVVSGIGRRVFPSGPVGHLEGRNDGGYLVDQRIDLVGLPQQIAQFADGVKIPRPKFRGRAAVAAAPGGRKQAVVDGVVTIVPGRSPRGVGIPGKRPQFSEVVVFGQVIRLEVVDEILVGAGPVIVVPDRFGHGVVGIINLQVDVCVDEVGTAGTRQIALVRGKTLDRIVVGAVGHRARGLVTLLSNGVVDGVDQFVEVAFLQTMAIEETHVVSFQGEVQPPKIATPLIGRLLGIVDHAEMKPVRLGGGNSDGIEQP